MKYSTLATLVMTVLGGHVAVAAGPQVVLETPDYDFGRMETNGTQEQAFMIGNRGDQPLRLSPRTNSCGCCTCVCEALLPAGGQIPAGQSAPVTLRWTIKQFTGAFQHTETLATNDPQRPELVLRVSGRVTPVVRVVPTQLVFSRVPAGQAATGEVRLYGYRSQPLQILGQTFSDPAHAAAFQIACEPLPADQVAAEPEARSGCLLRVTVQPQLAAGPFRQQLVLQTNIATAATIEIPVAGLVNSEVGLTGFGWEEQTGVLTLGTVAARRGTVRTVQLVIRGPQAQTAQPRLVRVVPDVLQAELRPPQRLGTPPVALIPVVIRIPPDSRPVNHLGSRADELGQIVIQTGHPRQPELRVLVRFAVKPDPPAAARS